MPVGLPLRLATRDGYRAETFDGLATGYVSAVIDVAPGTTETGLLFRASVDGDESYVLRLEPRRGRVVFDRWPRRRTGSEQWQISGDAPFAIELERPCRLDPGPHLIEVILDGSILVAVVDQTVALSTRVYRDPGPRMGFFVADGDATLRSLTMRARPPDAFSTDLEHNSNQAKVDS